MVSTAKERDAMLVYVTAAEERPLEAKAASGSVPKFLDPSLSCARTRRPVSRTKLCSKNVGRAKHCNDV